MSGPKTAHYALTPEQRRLLIEQQNKRRQYAMLRKAQKDAREVLLQADQLLEQLSLVQTDEKLPAYLQARSLKNAIGDAQIKCGYMTETSELKELEQMNRSLRQKLDQLSGLQQALEAELNTAGERFRSHTFGKIDRGFSGNFDNLGNNASPAAVKNILAELEALSLLMLSGELRQRLTQLKAQTAQMQDPGYIQNFRAVSLTPFARECREYDAQYRQFGADFACKLELYQENARELGLEPEQIPFSVENLQLLDEKLAQTQEALLERQEQAYISACVDEAIQALGYSVLGSREIVKRNGKRFRNALYLFEEGTAVNVTYGSDGQITMELGGLDTRDRMPTQDESLALEQDMRTFCGDFHALEKALLKKGIQTRRISMLPADARYAQIINVSDYQLQESVSEFRIRKRPDDQKQITREVGE